MKLVLISDTHGRHDALQLPEGDILIHAGDFSMHGSPENAIDFAGWLEEQPFKYKIVIAGNHDFQAYRQTIWIADLFNRGGATYLQDSDITIEGLRFWGSPWTPKFFDWAFMKDRGESIKSVWDKIPDNTQVLITHGPPHGILDPGMVGPPPLAPDGHAGCSDLLNRVHRLSDLKLHVFGHLHGGFGQWYDMSGREFNKETDFVNASQLNDWYELVNQPIVVEL